MSLSARITLVLSLVALLFFGGAGALQVASEERDLRRVAESEARMLGRSLQVSFENALRDRQLADVTETLTALERVDPSFSIFVYSELGTLVGASQGARASDDTIRINRGARQSSTPVVEFSPSMLRLGLRLRDETPNRSSAIVLEKPLAEMQRDLVATRRTIWSTTLLFVLGVAAITWLLTRRYIGTPLSRMVANMRRVRAGDLHKPQTDQGQDEVAQTQREFAHLVSDLADARERADREQDARLRMEHGLAEADKLITLGQLSAVMAHEIGSPLQVLEGRARALHKHANDADATRRAADILVEQTARIARIVEQMLSLTRRRAPQRSVRDAKTAIQSIVALLELEARRRRVHFEIAYEGATQVYADADQLQQVILNVLRNALLAAPIDSVVSIATHTRGGMLEIDIRDQGGGIAQEIRAQIFSPFITTRAHSGGTGLGLSVVHAIVRDHRGRVEVVDHEGSGCWIRISLPEDAALGVDSNEASQ